MAPKLWNWVFWIVIRLTEPPTSKLTKQTTCFLSLSKINAEFANNPFFFSFSTGPSPTLSSSRKTKTLFLFFFFFSFSLFALSRGVLLLPYSISPTPLPQSDIWVSGSSSLPGLAKLAILHCLSVLFRKGILLPLFFVTNNNLYQGKNNLAWLSCLAFFFRKQQ